MRKGSKFSTKRLSTGVFRHVAHMASNNKHVQVLGNQLLLKLLSPFGVTVEKAFENYFGVPMKQVDDGFVKLTEVADSSASGLQTA